MSLGRIQRKLRRGARMRQAHSRRLRAPARRIEKDALLRVDAFGLARCKSEECCVEHFSIGQDAAGVDKVRLIQRLRIDAAALKSFFEKNEIDSTPPRRFAQNSLMF